MQRYVAMAFCLLAYPNVGCHGDDRVEVGMTKSSESVGLSCSDLNSDPSKIHGEISVVTLKENTTGDWVTTFQADKVLDNSNTAVNLMIKQELVRCGEDEKMVVRTTGVMRDIDGKQCSVNMYSDKRDCVSIVRFNSDIKGENVMIASNGTTVSRVKLDELFATVLTERPLRDDEIFSIRIDKINETVNRRKSSTQLFGLLLNPTKDITSRPFLWGGSGVWSLVWNAIVAETAGTKAYSLDLSDNPDGTVLGVTRKCNGDVHYFKNGVDMGKAFEGVPQGVYAYFDLIHYVTQISVVGEKY